MAPLVVAEPHLDIERSMTFQRMGAFDATASCEPHRFVKRVSVGDAVVRHELTWGGGELRVEVSDGDPAALWARALPIRDAIEALVPDRQHLVLRHAVREFSGLRLVPVPWRFDLACGFVLQQRVAFGDAARQWNRIVARHGNRSEHGVAFPSARQLARLRAFELQALGVDARRAGTLIRLAREEAIHGIFALADRDALRARLRAIPGIGPWTTEMFFGLADGDPDAVPTGDLHLPELVTSILAGERGGDDARMLELLEPYRGQRHRVVRLLWATQFHRPDLLRRR